MALMIDALLIAGAVFLIARGAKRGLILSLFSLLTLVIALVGARYAVHTFAPPVAGKVAASVEQTVTEQLQTADFSVLSDREVIEQAIPEIIRSYGFYEKSADRLFALVQKAIDGAAENLIPLAAAETARLVADALSNALVFVVAFVLVMLVCKGASYVLHTVFQLPLLRECNALGGAIFGVVQAVLMLLLVSVLVRYAGLLVPQSLVEQTHVLRFLVNLI